MVRIPENRQLPTNKNQPNATLTAKIAPENAAFTRPAKEPSQSDQTSSSGQSHLKVDPRNALSIPVPAKMFGKTVARIKDFLDIARKEHGKGLPLVLVKPKEKTEESEKNKQHAWL